MATFLGAPTIERHFDAGGNLTGTTQRQSPFDDDSREAAYALWLDEHERCPDCGQPRDVCADRDRDYFPQRTICWATAARRVAQRRFDKRNENATPDAAGYLPDDGVTIWVAPHDLTPDDDFLSRPNERTEGG